MIDPTPSCAVAHPSERNRATTTQTAQLERNQDTVKPLSIGELRAQLKAQRERNSNATETQPETLKVAQGSSGELRSCAVAFPLERNRATEYVEQTPEEILSRSVELDSLIDRLCALVGFDAGARGRTMATRKRMAPADLPQELAYFRWQVERAKDGFYWGKQ